MTSEQRRALITRYAAGPELLRAALTEVPEAALHWRPAPGKWSVHEVIIHCADSETNSHGRIRTLLAEVDPVIQGYDQDRWAHHLHYYALPLGPALVTIEAVRANTVPLLEKMTEEEWARVGRHTESGTYSAEQWLQIYAEHLEIHAAQIRRNVAAWKQRVGG